MNTADNTDAENWSIIEVLKQQKFVTVHLLKQQQEVAERLGLDSPAWRGVEFLEDEVERLCQMVIDYERRLGLR